MTQGGSARDLFGLSCKISWEAGPPRHVRGASCTTSLESHKKDTRKGLVAGRRLNEGERHGALSTVRGFAGGGLNHLCEVEVPEMFAEIIGGRLNGFHMWPPTGHDLLGDPLLLGQAQRSSGSTVCRSRGSWLRQ